MHKHISRTLLLGTLSKKRQPSELHDNQPPQDLSRVTVCISESLQFYSCVTQWLAFSLKHKKSTTNKFLASSRTQDAQTHHQQQTMMTQEDPPQVPPPPLPPSSSFAHRSREDDSVHFFLNGTGMPLKRHAEKTHFHQVQNHQDPSSTSSGTSFLTKMKNCIMLMKTKTPMLTMQSLLRMMLLKNKFNNQQHNLQLHKNMLLLLLSQDVKNL